jgi:hypothetical protein
MVNQIFMLIFPFSFPINSKIDDRRLVHAKQSLSMRLKNHPMIKSVTLSENGNK